MWQVWEGRPTTLSYLVTPCVMVIESCALRKNQVCEKESPIKVDQCSSLGPRASLLAHLLTLQLVAGCGRHWPALGLLSNKWLFRIEIAVSFIKQFRWETMKNGKQTQVWSCCASSATSRNQGRSLALINSKFSIPPQVCSTGATGATGAGLGPSQHLRDIVLSNSLVRGMWIHQCAASLIEPLQTCKLAGSAPAEMYFVLKTPKKSTYRSSSTTVYLQPTLNIPKPHCCAWTFGGWSSNSWELSDFWTLLRWWWRCRWQIHLNGLAWFSFHWQSHCTLILCKLQGEDFTSWKWQPSHLLHWRKALWELCTVCTC